MPQTDTTPRLPFQGRGITARLNGRRAAEQAAITRPTLIRRYMALLYEHGLVTDEGAEEMLGCKRSSICSTRGNLMTRGLVEEEGSAPSKCGTTITLYKLTALGKAHFELSRRES